MNVKIKVLLIILSLLVTPIRISAFTVTIDDIVYEIESPVPMGQATVVSPTDKTVEYVEIPSQIKVELNTYRVTSIGDDAFNGCKNLNNITIPNSVTTIGSFAFNGCSGLTSFVIPNSVTHIGQNAFSECSSLKSITIPNSVKSIDSGAFKDCISLEEVSLPKYITSIAFNLFYNCKNLNSVTIPNTVKTIGYSAFYNCYGLTSIVLSNSIVTIDSRAFWGCSNLRSVSIPASVKSIRESAFAGCDRLSIAEFSSIESLCSIKFEDSFSNPLSEAHYLYVNGQKIKDLMIPTSVSVIGDYTFSHCWGLESITIPNSVSSIGNYSFSNCSGGRDLTIPNSVKTIGTGAFSNCNFMFVTIPNSVTEIGARAFDGCIRLIHAKFSSIESLCTIKFIGPSSNPLYHAHNLYIDSDKVTEAIIPPSVSVIGDYAFAGCSELRSVSIPNSVKTIGNDAFLNCTKLNKAEFSSFESLCTIQFKGPKSNPLVYAQNLYIGGKNIKDVYIPTSLSRVGDYTFTGCDLNSVTIPESIETIGKEALSQCSLYDVYSFAKVPPVCDTDAFGHLNKACILHVPSESKNAYMEAYQWKNFSHIEELSNEGLLVSEIEVNKSSVSLVVGGTETLEYNIKPYNATNKEVNWRSANPDVVTVSQRGELTAISVGESTIIVSATDRSGVTAEINVKIRPAQPETIIISAMGPTTLMDGQTVQLTAKSSSPDQITNDLIWQSDNEAIATVENGLVTAHSQLGVANISAIASNGTKGEIAIEVVETPVKNVNFKYNQLHLFEGQSETLEVEIYPENATNKTLTWYVSDESIITVDNNGVIKALRSGKAYVLAVTNNDVYGSLPVTVDKQVERIELADNYTVPLYADDYGQTLISSLELTPQIYPQEAAVKRLEWKSSNEKVGSVFALDNKYTFNAYAPGKTTLTCKATDGSEVTASCEVTVVFSEMEK